MIAESETMLINTSVAPECRQSLSSRIDQTGDALTVLGNVSELLVRWQEGDPAALEELMPLVYSELRSLGRGYLRRRPDNSLLQPTVLVHEAWLRLVRKQGLGLRSRSHFYALAARIMRDLLVDYYRQAQAVKRGGSNIHIALEDANPGENARQLDLLVLDDVIRRLGEIKPRYMQIVEIRFFGGLSIEETAEALNVSHATIEREWNFARAWLRRELTPARERSTSNPQEKC